MWWVHDDKKQYQTTIQPNSILTLECSLSHTFWIRDARVNAHMSERERNNLKLDDTLSLNSTMQIYKVLKDFPGQTFKIDTKKCFDLDTTCEAWKSAGNCSKQEETYMSYTTQYCRKTCGICSEDANVFFCEDTKDDCTLLADRGECTGGKKKHMKKNCPRTCGFCSDDCQDYRGDCPEWTQDGECQENETFMRLNCPLSCQFCSSNERGKKRYKKRRRHRSSSDSDDSTDSDDDDDSNSDSNDDETDGQDTTDRASTGGSGSDSSDSDDVDADELDELMGKFQENEATDDEIDRLLHLLHNQENHDHDEL